MEYFDPEADKWAENLAELWRVYPRQPFQAVPYDAVRGISWRIMDGDGRHVAIVFEEEAARLIAARLNA
jgi:hypothetical protein